MKLYYYDIALPINISQLFTYSSPLILKRGSRVIVNFRNQIYTGIIWDNIDLNDLSKEIQYKQILEVIDIIPLIDIDLLDLSQWISKYYLTSIGMAFFSMLPAGLNITLQQKARIIKHGFLEDSDGNAEIIITNLSSIQWTSIDDLKNNDKINRLYFWLEKLEGAGIIEVYRTYDLRIKNKVVNFIVKTDIQEIPLLTKKQNQLYQRINTNTEALPLSEIALDFSYSIVKALRNKGIINIEPREVLQDNLFKSQKVEKKSIQFTNEQKIALDVIKESIAQNEFQTFLLFGITGSGKTEVYIESIRDILHQKKTALMLVPEISLTPQMVEKFYNVFGETIAVLHSHLNEREKLNEWRKINSGRCKIVIGARSAIFAPLKNIGIIIVDEEHETSYKQDKAPRYNGRDIAIVRGKFHNAVVILGSATPSLESWANANSGKYELLTLTKRPCDYLLPSVKIIDMCLEKEQEKKENNLLSEILKEKIKDRLDKKEQIILFLNRRGHSSFLQCITCGKLYKCPNCEISYKYHSYDSSLVCHYCGHKIRLPRKCDDCGSYLFSFGSAGTQQAEIYLQTIFPTARILRMDADTTHKKNSYDSMFERMRNGNIDILLGTQMIAKGLDFPNVTLVGVLSADVSLNIPDFRASERVFQLLTQVAGRAGRGEKAGEVLIQTYNPEHYAIKLAKTQNYVRFAEIEILNRKELSYPPFTKLVRFLFLSKNEKKLLVEIDKYKAIINKISRSFKSEDVIVLGPIPAPFNKLKEKFRVHVIVKSKTISNRSKFISMMVTNISLHSSIRMTIDVDPNSLL